MKKILVIQQKMIGDVLVSSILCNNLRKAYPDAQIDYLVYESTLAVLQGNTNIDNIIVFTPKLRESRLRYYQFLNELDKNKYDIIIDAYSKLESWFAVFFLSAPQKISFKKPGRTFLYTHNIEMLQDPKTNVGLVIERRLSLLKPLQLNITVDPVPKLIVREDEKLAAKNLFEKHKLDAARKTVMISILGSSNNKTLPLKEMSKVVDFIVEESNVNILFNYFPKQIEDAKLIFDSCKKTTQKHIYFDLFGGSLREFIAIMHQCDLIIGNDGGAINMAKALNKPSFIIFSPWIEKKMWATFEDGVFHKSVHLKDYKPELFDDKPLKQLKKESLSLYKELKLSLFSNELKQFLLNNVNCSENKQLTVDFVKSYNVKEKLSVLIITYNEVDNVDDLVASVSFADEIIVVDSFSTDGTVEAFQKYENVKLIQHPFKDFSTQRNFAISQASNNWVLFVDADERISEALQKEINQAISTSSDSVVYGFYRRSFIDGKELKYGGHQTDKVYRLFHKKYASYDTSKLVHETLKIKGTSKLFKNKICHYSFIDEDDFKAKMVKYGRLRAIELYAKKRKPFFYHFYMKPAYRFFHLYIIRFGFLDGKNGFLMAKLSAFGVKQRYVALKNIYMQSSEESSKEKYPIDVVILWVDGEDEAHKNKMKPFLSVHHKKITTKKIKTRFGQVNEVEYAIKSIIKNAPYVRNIFLVTDNQTPTFLRNPIDDSFSKVKIVDHSVIFSGYENVLPTFNCLPIETMIYRVPNLAEHFIYFNDDVFLIKKTKREDFFQDGLPVLRGEWRKYDSDIWYKKLHQFFVKKIGGETKDKKYGFKRGQQNITKKLGFEKRYYKFDHTPAPLRKSTLEKYFNENPDAMLMNIKYRFRDAEQFTFQSLSNHIEIKNKTCILKNDLQLIYIGSYLKPLFWYKLIFFIYKKNSSKLFLCMQNLSLAPVKKQKYLLNKIKEL